MSVLFTDIIADAKGEADFDGVGAGASLNLDDARWSVWANGSIEALYKKFLIWNPDLFESTAPDYVLAAEEGSIAPPTDYRSFKGLTKSPDTHSARTVHRFNYGARDDQCDVHYREAGKAIRLEPKHRSNGTYRLTYTAGPVNLSTGDSPAAGATTDATAKAMVDNAYIAAISGGVLISGGSPDIWLQPIADLHVKAAGGLPGANPWIVTGSGVGKQLGTGVNGALAAIDGVTLNTSDLVLVYQPATGGGVSPVDYGVYRVASAGSVSTPPVLQRWVLYDEPSEIFFGSKVYVTNGTAFAGHSFAMNVSGTIVVDTTPLNFADTGTPTFQIDGVPVTLADHVFINTNGNQVYDGLYDLSVTATLAGAYLTFTRSTGQKQGTSHPVGYTIAVTQGVTNGNKIYVANDNVIWSVSSPSWSKAQAAIDPLYEPFREWLAVRTAMRALGKEESNTGELGTRLAELTLEAMAFVQSLDSGDGDCAVDVEGDHRPGIYRLLGH